MRRSVILFLLCGKSLFHLCSQFKYFLLCCFKVGLQVFICPNENISLCQHAQSITDEVVHNKLLLTRIGSSQQEHPPIHKAQALTKNVSACVRFTGTRLPVAGTLSRQLFLSQRRPFPHCFQTILIPPCLVRSAQNR